MLSRMPLSPVSPNGRVSKRVLPKGQDVARRARNVLSKMSLSSFSLRAAAVVESFSYFDMPEAGAEDQVDRWGDTWWLRNIYEFACNEIEVEGRLAGLLSERPSCNKYRDGMRFDGCEDYENHIEYMVAPGELKSLIMIVQPDEFLGFVQAEGLLYRLLFAVEDHFTRVMVLKMWLALVVGFCGNMNATGATDALRKLESCSLQFQSCPTPGTDLLGGFLKYSKSKAYVEARWQLALVEVSKFRDEHFGAYAYDRRMCGIHLDRCSSFMEEVVVDVSDSDSD